MRRRHPRSTLFPYTTRFRSSAESAPFRRKATALVIGQPEAAPRHLLLQDAVLLEEVLDDLLLLTIDPSDRQSTRLNSSHLGISYAVFYFKKKKIAEKKVLSS